MARQPKAAGSFYSYDKNSLTRQIKECFLSRLGPGKLPGKGMGSEVIGAVAPHAGYLYSGPCAAHTYKHISDSKKPDVYILLGLSHAGNKSSISLDDWQTPLGIAKTDRAFGEALISNTGIRQDESSHKDEHSIEVQLPFLQFIHKEAVILPLIASNDMPYRVIASGIAKTINETGKKACIIASSDFTHFGRNYGFFPFRDNIRENLYRLDEGAIKHALRLDAEGFLGYIQKTGATICGMQPVAVMLEACRALGCSKAKLIKYYTSADVTRSYESSVGYASIIAEKE